MHLVVNNPLSKKKVSIAFVAEVEKTDAHELSQNCGMKMIECCS